MAIIEHEDKEVLKKWGMGLESILEHCHFCRKPTPYWHTNTNNPVCQECAKTHRVSELPDYGQRVRAMKRKERANAGINRRREAASG